MAGSYIKLLRNVFNRNSVNLITVGWSQIELVRSIMAVSSKHRAIRGKAIMKSTSVTFNTVLEDKAPNGELRSAMLSDIE